MTFYLSYQYLVKMNRYFIASYVFVSSIKGEMFYAIINELGFFSLKPSKLMISDNRWSCFNLTKLNLTIKCIDCSYMVYVIGCSQQQDGLWTW